MILEKCSTEEPVVDGTKLFRGRTNKYLLSESYALKKKIVEINY